VLGLCLGIEKGLIWLESSERLQRLWALLCLVVPMMIHDGTRYTIPHQPSAKVLPSSHNDPGGLVFDYGIAAAVFLRPGIVESKNVLGGFIPK
jgi:hypothetical protein